MRLLLSASVLVALQTLANSNAFAENVQVVIGGLMESEGGSWDKDSGPLKHPFGIDFQH